MTAAITVENLVHTFGARRAVDNLSLEVQHGEVFGLLGPNGAGKTTTVRLLNGLYKAESGSVRILDMDPATQGQEVRARTGVLTETPALYERLSAYQNLEFFGKLAGMPPAELKARIEEMLAFFGLEKRANDKVGAYSKGLKQRLALARALLHRPEVLFLDEPTSGLDPESALQVRELIESIRHHNGHTVFLCTHQLMEAERLCDRMAILNSGRLLALGSLSDLIERHLPGMWVEAGLLQPLPSRPDLSSLPGVLQVNYEDLRVRVQVAHERAVPALVTALVQAGAQLTRVEPEHVTLEDVYFKLQEQNRNGAL
jgi:ABC-2 type transport system ATP-binding protein